MAKTLTSKVNPIEVQGYLSGTDYPATQKALTDTATSNDAPKEIIAVLEMLPNQEYASPADISREIGILNESVADDPEDESKTSAKVNPIKAQKYLAGMDYPVMKQDIVKTAKGHDAPKKIMNVLEQLPDQEYASPTDISREIGVVNSMM